jgi:hypothetical protein
MPAAVAPEQNSIFQLLAAAAAVVLEDVMFFQKQLLPMLLIMDLVGAARMSCRRVTPAMVIKV